MKEPASVHVQPHVDFRNFLLESEEVLMSQKCKMLNDRQLMASQQTALNNLKKEQSKASWVFKFLYQLVMNG